MFVITADQRRSRRATDLVPPALLALEPLRPAPVRAFERTAGDEIQGVADDPRTVVEIVRTLMRDGGWRVGIGIGPVEEPLPAQTRAGRGPAFLAARQAVRAAHSTPAQLAVAYAGGGGGGGAAAEAAGHAAAAAAEAAGHAESALWLLCFVLRARSPSGWEVTALLERGLTQQEAAERLRISPSAVSQRVRRAGWLEQQRAEALARHHLSVSEGRTGGDGIPTRCVPRR